MRGKEMNRLSGYFLFKGARMRHIKKYTTMNAPYAIKAKPNKFITI